MKKYVLVILLLSSYSLLLSACSHNEKEKIQVYLDKNNEVFYKFLVVDFKEGKLNIEVKMPPNYEKWSNEAAEIDINIEIKAILEAVKEYSKKHLDTVKVVYIYFITFESNKLVLEINVNSDTILGNNWSELDRLQLSQIVDSYKFYGVSN